VTNHDEKSVTVGDITYRYSTSWIRSLESEEHWRLYWRQQKIMEGLVVPNQHVLELGIGTGFTANYLRSKGVRITTVDIDPDKKPDIIANIANYNFEGQFDHVLGYEVFEHIPFERFEELTARFAAGICQGFLFLSVPRNERVWARGTFRLPKLGERSFEITTRKRKITSGHHFWEVDYGEVTMNKFEWTLRQAGFRIFRKEKVFSRLFYALKSPDQSR
jgi:SAM-dependent methyltransferase